MMGNYEQLKTAVASIIRDNGEEEITGNVLQSVLISIINSVGSGAVFAGIATPSTSPSNPDPNMFYIAVEAGTYPNFNLTVTTGMCIFTNESGTWVGHELGISSQFESGEYITDVSITDTLEGAETDNLPTVGAVNEAVTALNTSIATERHDRQEADGNQTVALNLEKTLRQQGDEANSASVGYYVCDTAAAPAAKVVNASGYVLSIGGNIHIKMTNANTAGNVTLNINSTGAKALYYNGEQASASNSWEAGEVLTVYYDGTQYQCASGGGGKDLEDDEYVLAKALNDHNERIEGLENTSLGDDEGFVIAKALAKLNNDIKNIDGDETETSSETTKGVVTYQNSDRIAVISSSFGAGNFALAGKNWVAKISLFSDYAFQNNSADGASYMSQLSSFRNYNSFNCKYALAVNCENATSISVNTMVKALDNMCRLLVGMGTTPVIGTQYKSNVEWSNAFKEYAELHQYEFMDLRYYCRNINKSLVGPFDAGTHLGTRSDAVMSDLFTRYVDMLPRPKRSLKVFKLRNTNSAENLDSLVFHTNEERAERFEELNFVAWGLADPARVDSPNQGAQQTNEYNALYSAAGMTFAGAALVSAVLPCTNQNLVGVSFSASFNGNVKVYARSVVAQPYPAITTYVRFTVMDAGVATPSANDVYNDGTNNYTVYTIVLGENGSNYTMYCVGTYNEGDPTIGTLTKVGGDGPSIIPYALREASSFSADDVVLQDTVGHWVELTGENGVYRVPQYRTSVDYDKIHFLIVGSSFTMYSPSVSYEGVEGKDYNEHYDELVYNEDNPNTELIDESVFGSVGTTLTHWVDGNGNGVVTENVYEGSTYLPSGCGSIVNLTNTSTMEQSFDGKVTSDAPMSLEVWCRYFPAVYSDGSGNQITPTSYDYTQINIQIGDITFKRRVSTAWGKLRLDLRLLYSYSSSHRKIKIFADNSYGVQVCKVSLKYK